MSGNRTERLDALRRRKRTQVLVVGGGINGISVYRELALNGVDVVLVERDDFMSGASSAPSRMIHGGLRYMENGEFALVRESLRERNLLLANAPHLVRPLPTLIPITSRFSGIWSAACRFFGLNVAPGDRGALIIKLGLSLYDLYAGAASGLPRHRFFGRRATLSRWPGLRGDVVAGAVYHDAKISHPERLGIEMVLECEGPHALALNHVGLSSLTNGRASLEDTLSGEQIELDVDIVVNATGGWIDATNGVLAACAPTLIGGTKGSHIVIANQQLKHALGDAMVYFANREGRVCILFVHLGNVLAGSTDIRVASPEAVRCEDEEVDYILGSVREVFPHIAISADEIVYRFAGVRPLPSSDGKVNANISRDHSCEWLDKTSGASRPVLNLVGGKWTTFRAFGEEAADKILEKLGQRRSVRTKDRPIGGGGGFPRAEGRRYWIAAAADQIDAAYASLLLDRYGTRAFEPEGGIARAALSPLPSLPGYTREEIEWLVETEHVETLEDLVLRRLTIAFSGELSLAAIDELSGIAASCLDWHEARRASQVEALLVRLEKFHGLSAQQLATRNRDWKDDNVRRQKSANEQAVRQRQMS